MNSDLTPWQAEFMRATKANIDLLTGANGITHMALIRGDVTSQEVAPTGITGSFDSADYIRVASQLITVTNALNRLISELN